MIQDPPFAIQLEPVEGCSLACSFCALQTLRDNGASWATGKHGKNSTPYRFAEVAMFDRIAENIKRLGWNPRIEFAMHGEPTMHPNLDEIIGVMRRHLPKHYFLLTTNGSGLIRAGAVQALFDAGLDTLAFDYYNHASWAPKVADILAEYACENLIYLWKYPAQKEGNPHHRWRGQRIVIIADISANASGTHQLTNQGGNSGKAAPLEQRCAKPFRELSIRWDGNVAICCDDWRGEYKVGNARDGLEHIWQHPRMQAARVALYAGQRSAVHVCSGCNVRTYRNGLLPDKYGKQKMPAPNVAMRHIINVAQGGRVFTIKVVK